MTKFGRDECRSDGFSSSVGWPENGVGDLANCILIVLFSMRMQYNDKAEETIAVAGTGDAPDGKSAFLYRANIRVFLYCVRLRRSLTLTAHLITLPVMKNVFAQLTFNSLSVGLPPPLGALQ